jgi:oligoendopeptidase F
LRAKLLGIERLATYDVYAPIETTSETISWDEAREIVLGAYGEFSSSARDIVGRFFDERWIDAAPRDGKAPGAFCVRPAPGAHPYILMTYSGSRRSLATLAHELGHGVHAVLSEPRGYLNMSYPLTIAETASVFGESLTYDAMRARAATDAEQLSLLVSQIDTLVRTAFMPIAGNRFEHALHTTRRAEGELPVARINELWVEQFRDYWGDSVDEPEERASWWSLYPHFAFSPGYMYPYSFGVLLSFSIYRRWVEQGDALVDPIFDFLRAGSTASPEELVRRLGLDLADPGFWASGIDAIEALVAEAEALAARVGDGGSE